MARGEMRRAICESVVDIGSAFALYVADGDAFLGLVGPESDPLARPQILQALRHLVSAAGTDEQRLGSQLQPDLASSRTLYEQVSKMVGSLRVAMTTRVVVLDEPELVILLLNLERAERRWGSWVQVVERDGAPDDIAWRHATVTLRACADVYDHFLT